MPVFLNAKNPELERLPDLDWPSARTCARGEPAGDVLRIGLVNNMADGAMVATENQFLSLLDAAAGDMRIHLTLYVFPEVERKSCCQRRVDSLYFSSEQLWNQPPEQRPHALIITGREPRTPDLRHEVYWPGFVRLLEWTQEYACSAIWSCLAAHAAVLALDGIQRVRSERKHFGIFPCEQVEPHGLLAGTADTLHVPHSRWNGLCAGQLAARGYRALTRTCDGAVDAFVKHDRALFVFFQGHPEYESETLLGEYRRDVGRYLRGEMAAYPLLPLDYFDEQTEQSLREIEIQARASREERLLEAVSALLSNTQIQNTWRSTAVCIYRNWLDHLGAQQGL